MDKILKLLTRLLLVLVTIAPIVAHSGGNKENPIYEIFGGLRLVYQGIDFPANIQTLQYCRKQKDKNCLSTYSQALKGKKKLLELPHDDALNLTLETIKSRCSQPYWDSDEIGGCDGANAALYFFNSIDDDEKIRLFFKHQNATLQYRMLDFMSIYEWIANRPDKKKWVEIVKKMNHLTQDDKSFFLRSILKDRRKILIKSLD